MRSAKAPGGRAILLLVLHELIEACSLAHAKMKCCSNDTRQRRVVSAAGLRRTQSLTVTLTLTLTLYAPEGGEPEAAPTTADKVLTLILILTLTLTLT